jgi:flagellar biosynthesis protein FlhB
MCPLLLLLQFFFHFIGYILLEVSQTILVWLHSNPEQWNRHARASQEFVGIFFALLMLVIEVVDWMGWSREAYHRRLTMTTSDEEVPELYNVPGESS